MVGIVVVNVVGDLVDLDFFSFLVVFDLDPFFLFSGASLLGS